MLLLCFSLERVDQAGVICKQEGIFRVNCMDCLDRTNVVQAAIARVVMEQQARMINVLFQVPRYLRTYLLFTGSSVCLKNAKLTCTEKDLCKLSIFGET